MPFVPMPGAMPRGWSFRDNNASRRTLGQQSLASAAHRHRDGEAPSEMVSSYSHESVVDLPNESEPYDTPFREDLKDVIDVAGQQSSKIPKHGQIKRNSHQKESTTVYNKKPYEEADDDTVPIAEASYVAELSAPTCSKRASRTHHRSRSRDHLRSSYVSDQPTIALFGGTGVTGGHFMTAALDAGYCVRCVPADDPREVGEPSGWEAIKHSLEDPEQIRKVVYRVDHVVVMLNDVLPSKTNYPGGFMAGFIERLYTAIREESTVQVVLFQATSLAIDITGRIPILSKVIKTVAHRRNAFLQDQDAAIHRIGMEHGLREYNDENRSVNLAPPHFKFIITRPSVLLQDGPSNKKLAASKSQPGPFPVAHIDLADFSLSALTAERMYNSSPYVVADGF